MSNIIQEQDQGLSVTHSMQRVTSYRHLYCKSSILSSIFHSLKVEVGFSTEFFVVDIFSGVVLRWRFDCRRFCVLIFSLDYSSVISLSGMLNVTKRAINLFSTMFVNSLALKEIKLQAQNILKWSHSASSIPIDLYFGVTKYQITELSPGPWVGILTFPNIPGILIYLQAWFFLPVLFDIWKLRRVVFEFCILFVIYRPI